MAVADPHAEAHHDDHHHDHGEFIAHHFDSAEQQFDSGKLGIWVFLVTEILFFSGLFVAYILYRNHHPEIFEQAHVFSEGRVTREKVLDLLGGVGYEVMEQMFTTLQQGDAAAAY